jgi:hypothetical protein
VGGTCGTHGKGEGCVQGFGCESLKERDHSEDQSLDGRMGSEWVLRRLAGGCRVDPVGSGCCECGDEPAGSAATEGVRS